MFKTIHDCGLELVASTRMHQQVLGDETDNIRFVIEPYSDMMPVRAARASFGKQDKTGEKPEADIKLMHFLAEHQHMTPFEYQHATFLIECPLFIRSQIHRHRTFAYNEISRRYTSENLEFWIPDKFRGQAKDNKQASDGEISNQDGASYIYVPACEAALINYNHLLEMGVSREQARAILPQSLLTRFYMGGTLRNWAHFIELRRDAHAQYEVQVIANRVADELRKLWPESCNALGI